MGRHSGMICPGVATGAWENGSHCTPSHGLQMQRRASCFKVSPATSLYHHSRDTWGKTAGREYRHVLHSICATACSKKKSPAFFACLCKPTTGLCTPESAEIPLLHMLWREVVLTQAEKSCVQRQTCTPSLRPASAPAICSNNVHTLDAM